MIRIHEIEGIGPIYAAKLAAEGITTVEALLHRASTEEERMNLSKQTGIELTKISKWVRMADFFRIKGIGEEYSELLEASGLQCVQDLLKFEADQLWGNLQEVNEKKKLVTQLPNVALVKSWIDHAYLLPKVLIFS